MFNRLLQVLLASFILLTGCAAHVENKMMDHMSMAPAMKAHGGIQHSLNFMDFNITFDRLMARTGNQTPLKFALARGSEPLTELQVMHDKLMHVILVRKDLTHFDHIHPEQPTPGTFVVPYTFAAAGEYRVWADFMYGGMPNIIDFDMNVTGKPEADEPDKLHGINVTFTAPEHIEMGKQTKFSFNVADSNGTPVPITEKFLAADGHMIIIDETLDEFEHAHDETNDHDNVLSFEYTPELSGKHMAWVQFSVNGTARTAGFEIVVQSNVSANHLEQPENSAIGELLRLQETIQQNKTTAQDLTILKILLKNDSHASGELQELTVMVNYGEYQHADHSIGLLLNYLSTGKDLLCPGHALSHYYIYLKHGEKELASHALEEAKEQLPHWIEQAKNYTITIPEENFDSTFKLIQKRLAAIDAGNPTATDKDIAALSDAFCAHE